MAENLGVEMGVVRNSSANEPFSRIGADGNGTCLGDELVDPLRLEVAGRADGGMAGKGELLGRRENVDAAGVRVGVVAWVDIMYEN